MIRNNSAFVSKKHNQGAAMIVVVCVLAVVMILSLTIMMTGYQMLATVSDDGRDELYYQQVMSFSKVLKQRLEENDTSDELIAHIDDFMSKESYKTVDREVLLAAAPTEGGSYGGIRLTLDKVSSHNNLVVIIDIMDDDKSMATCTCKYLVKSESGGTSYTFDGYY